MSGYPQNINHRIGSEGAGQSPRLHWCARRRAAQRTTAGLATAASAWSGFNPAPTQHAGRGLRCSAQVVAERARTFTERLLLHFDAIFTRVPTVTILLMYGRRILHARGPSDWPRGDAFGSIRHQMGCSPANAHQIGLVPRAVSMTGGR